MKKSITRIMAALALLVTLAIPMGVWGQAPVGTTLWGETWTGGEANETPSAYGFEGTTVYGGATLTYAQSSTNTKLYEEALAGGESPELLLSKSNQTWTISNIPTGQATGMALTFKSNKTTFDVTSTTTGITISGSQKSWTIAATSSVTTFNLTIKNTGSSNARIDDIVLSVTTAGGDTPQPTTYTVTYDCNGGTSGCPQNVTGIEPNTQIQLADAPSKDGFDFDGWSDGNTTYGENEDYTVTGNVTFTAQWTENTTPTPGGTTATLNIQAYAEANSWTNGTQYTTATVAPVTFTANGGGNTGKYYTSGQDWRFYQGEDASITISVPEGFTLVSVTPTYGVSNGGVLKNGTTTIASGTTVSVSGTSVTFTVGNSGSATNGQVRFTNIDVVYVSDGGTQTASDLTITNQSTDLTFDLYNNTTAQVISYTTSSTGAITITPAESDYFSYVHDATAKTITVTPTAVTPSAQTVTISQAADDDYYAGTATFTVSVANSDPNLPGTENNPYTVAQARAAIDANAGTQGVYATGIVSEIVTAYNSTYGNITFDIVDEVGNSATLRAYRCGGTEAANVAVNDIVVVYGNLTKYGSTYEFSQDCQLVSLTHPAVAVEAPTFSPVAGTYAEVQTVAISSETEGADIYYTLDGTDPTMESSMYENPITVSETTTIKAIAVNGDDVASNVASANYYFCSADDPYTVTEALAFQAYQYPANGIYVHGIVSTAPTQAPTNNGELTYYISVDGEATNQLEVYKGKGLEQAAFTAQDDLQVGDIVTVYGNVQVYNSTIEFATGNYLVSFERPEVPVVPSITVTPATVEVDAEEHDGTLDLAYENLEISDMTDFDIQYYDAEGEETETPDWIEVLVAEQDPEIGEGYVVSYYMFENEGEARSAYFKVFAAGDEDFVYSNLVTISQAAPVVPATPGTWVLTDLTDLTENDVFVIVGTYEDLEHDSYAMSNDKGTQDPPVAVAVTVVDGTLSGEPAANIQWTLGITDDGYIFYPNGTTETWLYCTNTNNGVRVGTNATNDIFTMSDGYMKNTATRRYVGIYNTQDWRCYTNTTGNIANQSFAFYKRTVEPETYTLTIEGYGDSDGGYYLIASPVNVNPANVQGEPEGMTEGNFDLYYFDQAEDQEWRNYEANPFNLVPGKGYLYAHDIDVTLTLTGAPYQGDGEIELAYTVGGDFPGWNLVGNPFGQDAEISNDYYVMNDEGTELIAGETYMVAPMQGVFVVAEGEGESVIFEPVTAPTPEPEKLVMNVRNNRGNVIDRAMIRFGEGRQLPKFMFNDDNTKLYIAEGNEEFAVVRSINENTTPVSFHAAENGTYTLSINAENVEMEYLHLLDNMTGADVDLLATPSYTFEARTTDYANRFKLVYATTTDVNENNVEPFAFFNGSEWVINNEGEATLQVIDINGRMLSNETVNGNAEINFNQPAGVYMLRLVNGDNVKTQKVVVK